MNTSEGKGAERPVSSAERQDESEQLQALFNAAVAAGHSRADLSGQVLWQTVGRLQHRIVSAYSKPSEKQFAREVLREMMATVRERNVPASLRIWGPA